MAANLEGNWDIWMYDGQWRRLTKTPSIELDPWWENGTLVYASNLSGKFQIHGADRAQITHAEHVAILPRQGRYLGLREKGWRIETYQIERAASLPQAEPVEEAHETTGKTPELESRTYTPLKSIWPNYIRPDAFAAVTDFQIGLATKGNPTIWTKTDRSLFSSSAGPCNRLYSLPPHGRDAGKKEAPAFAVRR